MTSPTELPHHFQLQNKSPHFDEYGNLMFTSEKREKIKSLVKLKPHRITQARVKEYENMLVAKAARRRKTFPILAWLFPDPTPHQILRRFWDPFKNPGNNTASETEQAEIAIAEGNTVLATQPGETVEIKTQSLNVLLHYSKLTNRILGEEDQKDEIFSNWKTQAQTHPDNGKAGWWRVSGIRHTAHTKASSATQAIENADKAEIVHSSWEAPSAEYLGEELPETF